MKKKIFFLLRGRSAVNTSFLLARLLTSNGYDVLFLVFGSEYTHVRNNGFRCALINPRERRRQLRSATERARYLSAYEYVVNRKIEKLLLKEQPSVCLTESFVHSVSFIKHKVPLIFFENYMVHRFSLAVPSVFTSVLYSKKWYAALLNGWSWLLSHQQFIQRTYRLRLYSIYLMLFRNRQYARMDPWKQIRRYGGKYYMSEMRHRLVGYDYYAFPVELDFPGKRHRSEVVYGGTHVCPDRSEEKTFDLKPVIGQKVIYCSLGTLSFHVSKKVKLNFYGELLAAMRQRPDLHLILSLPKTDAFPELLPYPGNVQVYDFVPQMKVLQMSDLFITHGGSSSIRESVYFGVPMLVYPLRGDQLGNGARVVYHRLGIRGRLKRAHKNDFIRKIDQVLTSPEIDTSIRKFQKIFQEQNDCQKGLQFIEKVILH